MSSSKNNCSVFGCSNTYANWKNKNRKLHLYFFPSQAWESDRKALWIRFCKRQNSDGTYWVPNKNAFICSEHFVDKVKRNHPYSLSYNPSVFNPEKEEQSTEEDVLPPYCPDISTNQSVNRSNRFDRTETRNSKKRKLEESMIERMPKDASTQTDDKTNYGSVQMFSCHFVTAQEASTQVQHKTRKTKPILVTSACGPNYKSRTFLGFDSLSREEYLLSLTGVSRTVFDMVVRILKAKWNHSYRLEDNLLICLVKLKLGISFSSIAALFNIHRTTAQRIFTSILRLFYKRTKRLIRWPSKEKIRASLPDCFKQDYPDTRVIIDCTEIKTATPQKSLKVRNTMYSNYKSTHTAKVLIAIAPNGLITFLSDAYGGRASDTLITNDSGFLELLEPNDLVMADKGFPKINTKNVIMVIPPRAKPKQKQFSAEQMDETYKIARVRIHVERVIQRIKTFNILNNRLPLDLVPYIDQILHMCCVLTNFDLPIIKK